MCDSGCDNDTPLKQVVQLAGKGLQFTPFVTVKNSFELYILNEEFKIQREKREEIKTNIK